MGEAVAWAKPFCMGGALCMDVAVLTEVDALICPIEGSISA
jgi:hypothetical protein